MEKEKNKQDWFKDDPNKEYTKEEIDENFKRNLKNIAAVYGICFGIPFLVEKMSK